MSRMRNEYLLCASVIEEWYRGERTAEDAHQCLMRARASCPPEMGALLDELLLHLVEVAKGELEVTRLGLLEAQDKITAAEKLLEHYNYAPLISATFLGFIDTAVGVMARVSAAGGRRIVALAEQVDRSSLRPGVEVSLNSESSVLVATAEGGRVGEVAEFVRYTADGRIVVRASADDQIVAQPGAALDDAALRAGDKMLWDRQARLVLEKLDDADGNPYAIPLLDPLPLEKVGGRKDSLRRLEIALTNCLLYPERAKSYGLPTSNMLLLYGPTGSGKTYLVRAVLSELQRATGRKVMFASVKAAEWDSPYVGMTQANISSLFQSLRRAADEGQICVVFVDEIDAIGRTRGGLAAHHDDKALAALLTELSGFEALPNVSFVGAVNRRDLLDPALLGRFGEEICIPRPDLHTAKEIFEVHLDANYPYQTQTTRLAMIDVGVSELFAPNAASELCVLKLQDGRTRPVHFSELVSARLICQITQSARRRAQDRWDKNGVSPLRVDDMVEAIADQRDRLSGTLTPYNCHHLLEGLPTDEGVLAVERSHHRTALGYRYVSLS